MNMPIVRPTITFILKDSRSKKPILEIKLPSSILAEKNETCLCINLKDYGIELEPGVLYRWRLWNSRSLNIVAGGLIQRCGFNDCLMVAYLSQSEL